jgi:hypothetical protein
MPNGASSSSTMAESSAPQLSALTCCGGGSGAVPMDLREGERETEGVVEEA